jgi:hypothetical protein
MKKRPRDRDQRATLIIGAAGEKIEKKTISLKQIARLGGLKGGPARAASLSPQRRREIAQKAADARWGNKQP